MLPLAMVVQSWGPPYAQDCAARGVAFVQVRYNVDLSALRVRDPSLPETDTITGGFIGFGIGGGIVFQVSKSFGIGIELHTMTIVPNITFAIDTELRLRFRF